MSVDSVLAVVYLAVGLLIGLVAHEFAHALAATRLGDPTPRMAGRLTLNPKPHLDPFGSLLLPAIILVPVLFGKFVFPPFAYAKPQALNPWSLRNPNRSGTLVALAGPAANLLLALVFGGLFRVSVGAGELERFLGLVLLANVSLGILNLVPLPGLDGARVVARFLPPRPREVYTNLEQYAPLFVLFVFFVFAGPIFDFLRVVGNGVCNAFAGIDCF